MGLIAHYPLNGNANDALGRYNGTASNVTWVDGKLGQAGSFPTTSSDIVTGAPISKISGSFSLSYWVYATGLNPDVDSRVNIITLGATTAGGYHHLLHNHGGVHAATWSVSGWGGGPSNSTPPTSVVNNKWVNVVAVIDSLSSTSKIFIDGGLVSSLGLFGEVTKPMNFASDTIFIGGTAAQSGSERPSIIVDDVRIYDHALSKREIRDLCRGKVLSVSLRSDLISDKALLHNIVPVGSSEFLPEDSAWSVQESGNYIDTTYAPYFDSTSNEFTIATWFKHSSSTGARRLFGARDGSKPGNPLIELFGGYTRVQALIRGNDGSRRDIAQSVSLDPTQFHHLVWVCSNGNSFLYLNGNLVGQNTSGYDPLINLKDVSLPIGGTRLESSVSSNEIDIVRSLDVFHTALSVDEVKELYQQRASLDAQGNLLC